MEVIIVTYNNEATIKNCLESICRQDYKGNLSVKVFDNNSTDNTNSILKKYIPSKHIKYQYFKNITNIGFGRACNYYGLQANSNILFLNPDTELVFENTLTDIEKQLNDSVRMIGVTHKDYNGIDRTKGVIGALKDHYDRIKDSKSNECLYVSGGFMLISHKDFKALKGFDELFYLYYEDFDLAIRLKQLYPEAKIINIDELYIRHQFQGSKIDMQVRMKYIMESKKLFENKWGVLI